MSEEWRQVPGFKDREISISTKEGKCRNTNWRRTGRTWYYNTNPHPKLGRIYWGFIDENGKHVVKQAAVWIAMTYPELVQNEWFPGAEIDHIDTDRLNNHPSNLRWVTRKGNQNNPLTRQHNSEVHKNRQLNEKELAHLQKLNSNQKGTSHPRYGTHHSEETKKKMREAWKRRRAQSI